MSDLEQLMLDAPNQASRLRLVAVHCQLEVVADDGVDLTPVPTASIVVPATAWPPDLGAILAELQQRYEASL